MSQIIYNLVILLLSPLLVLLLLWRRAKGKEPAWAERWGKLPTIPKGKELSIWVHAVSVGEVMAAAPVLRELRKRHPEAHITLSTTTTGGREVALQRLEADRVVAFPLDAPWAVKKALAAVQPDLVLLMEWEIWPNFLVAAKRRGAKIAVLNGRVSDKGLRRGLKMRWLLGEALKQVDLFAMQSDEDARRAVLVGAPAARMVTFGNTKFDEASTPLSEPERIALRAELGIPEGAPVWVCGSTRDGRDGIPDEEVLIAQAVAQVRARFPDLRLIVAPRHLERADVAATHLGHPARRSKKETGPVVLLDTFGELARVYAIADVAFVGGSLAPWGGQSVFQPLAQGVPALFGPHMNNQRDIAALSQAEGVGIEVTDAAQLADEVVRLLSLSADERMKLQGHARGLIERHQGVTARALNAVEALLGR
jgi:3-deoxy-D-manno-octulosonic-acid transferase